MTLRQIVRSISIHSKKLMQKCGLSTPQLLILREIEKEGEVPTGIVSHRVSLSNATVTSVLDRLVAKGLVARIRSEADRRKVLVKLTDEGKIQLKEAPSLLQEDFAAAFDKLEEWEKTLILSSLQRVANMMKAGDIPTSPVLSAEEI